ncbi:Pantothenate kinase type III, CoaX-like [hydrothermal vent metagenome]|uniref:Type III pantothenate kinase n=1 Tax=hydrothermal vent metagenome TaxID=652676 RepID=A0A3B0T1W1_9ZZZZ
MSLLAVDIGNTSISFGVVFSKKIKSYSCDVGGSKLLLSKNLTTLFRKIHRENKNVEKVVVCSVVPRLNSLVRKVIVDQFKIRPVFIGKDLIIPIKNKYRNPQDVGADRLVCAYAAKILYGAPTIVIDFGTAITFDVVNKKGEYEGGIIVPGMRLSAESLSQKGAMLPSIKDIKPPKTIVGKTTVDSILSGLFYGYGAMSSGLINQLNQLEKGKIQVVVTGGYASLMKKFISAQKPIIDKNLVFRGIKLLSEL